MLALKILGVYRLEILRQMIIEQEQQLTTRQSEIAKLLAWGFTKKEIANTLSISELTVENLARVIYKKANVNSVGQLSAWWFCKNYDIPAQDKPTITFPTRFDFGDYGIFSYGFIEN